MKSNTVSYIITICIFSIATTFEKLNAQFVINPQAGITAQTLANEPSTIEQKARVGYTFGIDGRWGNKFYFQPGVFYGKASTQYTTYNELDTLQQNQIESKLDRTILTVKLFAGYNLVHKDGFKLRINAGPYVDFITNVKDEKELIDEGNFNSTLLNFKVAGGLDIWFLTAELGYGWGITNAFDDTYGNEDSKFNQLHLTVGITFGGGEKD